MSDGASEEDATKGSPEVFVENRVNDLKSSTNKRKVHTNSINLIEFIAQPTVSQCV